MDGNILHYVKNFLSNRSFQVQVNGILSDQKILENGVPQGEFLVAINKITEYISRNDVKTLMFADVLVVYVRGKDNKLR